MKKRICLTLALLLLATSLWSCVGETPNNPDTTPSGEQTTESTPAQTTETPEPLVCDPQFELSIEVLTTVEKELTTALIDSQEELDAYFADASRYLNGTAYEALSKAHTDLREVDFTKHVILVDSQKYSESDTRNGGSFGVDAVFYQHNSLICLYKSHWRGTDIDEDTAYKTSFVLLNRAEMPVEINQLKVYCSSYSTEMENGSSVYLPPYPHVVKAEIYKMDAVTESPIDYELIRTTDLAKDSQAIDSKQTLDAFFADILADTKDHSYAFYLALYEELSQIDFEKKTMLALYAAEGFGDSSGLLVVGAPRFELDTLSYQQGALVATYRSCALGRYSTTDSSVSHHMTFVAVDRASLPSDVGTLRFYNSAYSIANHSFGSCYYPNRAPYVYESKVLQAPESDAEAPENAIAFETVGTVYAAKGIIAPYVIYSKDNLDYYFTSLCDRISNINQLEERYVEIYRKLKTVDFEDQALLILAALYSPSDQGSGDSAQQGLKLEYLLRNEDSLTAIYSSQWSGETVETADNCQVCFVLVDRADLKGVINSNRPTVLVGAYSDVATDKGSTHYPNRYPYTYVVELE